MAWQAIDRVTAQVEGDGKQLLGEAVREKIRAFLPRYETKRAALLPALHIVQDAIGHVSLRGMQEIAEVLEIPPSQVMDTMTFYTHFWDHPKGKKVIVLCRSLSCQLMGADSLLETVKSELGIDEHETTKDGQYSLLTEECLAACDHAPCMLVNEKMHKCVKQDQVAKLLKDAKVDQLMLPRSTLYDKPEATAELPMTSDVREMKEA